MIKKLSESKYLIPLIFLVGALMRIGPSAFVNLWRDEAYEINIAKLPVDQIIRITALDTQPPLHLLISHFVGSFAGYSEFAMRSISIVAGILTLWLIYKIGNKLFKTRSAQILFLLINAINPVLIYYSQEARSYAMIILFAVASVYLLLQIEDSKKQLLLKYVFLFLLTLAGIYTSTVYFVFIGILFVVYAIYTRNLKAIFKLGIPLAAALLLYLPWLNVTLNQATVFDKQGFWLTFDPIYNPIYTLSTFYSGEINLWVQLNMDLCIICAITGFILLVSGIYLEVKHKSNRAIFTTFFLTTFIAFEVISFRVPIFYYRYMSFLTPFLLGILIVPFEYLKNIRTRELLKLVLFMFIVASTISTLYNIVFNLDAKENYRAAVAAIKYDPKTDVILHKDALAIHGFKYYSTLPSYIYPEGTIPYYEGLAAIKPEDYMTGDLSSYKRIWAFDLGDQTGYTKKLAESGFELHSFAQFSGGLQVGLYLNSAEN